MSAYTVENTRTGVTVAGVPANAIAATVSAWFCGASEGTQVLVRCLQLFITHGDGAAKDVAEYLEVRIHHE